MLAQRSLPLLGQQVVNKSYSITRNITLTRQSPHLFKQCQQHKLQSPQSRQPQQQQQLLPQQQKHFSSSTSLKPLTFTTWSAIKANFHKNIPKGGVCLVLLPVSAVSCTASVKLSTSTSAQSSTGKSSSIEESNDMTTEDYRNAKSIYEFTVKDTHGNDVSLEKYKGHVVLIVNIASQCGLTKNNYKKLTDLKEKYHDKGLRILNFPCNQFGSQMPEADGEPMVCHLRDSKADIGDVFQKVDVNGSDAAPIYRYLKDKQGGTLGSAIKWNFTKFLINKEGIPVNRYAPTTDPMDIAKDIEKLL